MQVAPVVEKIPVQAHLYTKNHGALLKHDLQSEAMVSPSQDK